MSTRSERLKILDLIDRGEITTREGTALLEVLGPAESEAAPQQVKPAADEPAVVTTIIDKTTHTKWSWKDWWVLPLGLGIGIIFLGILAIYLGIRTGGFNLWYLAAVGPYIIWVVLIAVAVQLRIKIEKGQRNK